MMKRLLSKIDPNLRRLFTYVLQYKGKLFLAGLFLLGSASTSSLTATLLGKLTDLGFYEQEKWVIIAAPCALLAVSLLFAVCAVMSAYLMAKISQSVLVTFRTALFEHILRWPAGQYQTMTTGRISSKFVNEAAIALSGATDSISVLVRDSVQVAALLGVLFWHNWQLTLVTFLVAPGLVFILRTISKKMRVIVHDSQETMGAMVSRVQESYSAERLVKVSGTYDFEDERFETVNEKIRKLALKTIKMQSLATPLTQILTMVAVAFVVGMALLEAQKGLLTIGEFITFLSAMLLMKAPIQHLAGLNATFASLSVAAKSIFETLDAPLEEDKGTQVIDRAKGNIAFEHVSLRYPGQDKEALKDVHFSIPAGQHFALVGQSGSGKTSLVNLLPRFWDVTQGRITIDGIDIRDLTLESLRKQISIVSQDVILFDNTVRHNIMYGSPNATEEDLQRAIKAAALEGVIAGLPQGLDTRVGEGGGLLSGGQKQRISIARAFLKNSPILIMDEATSALDSETETQIKEALKQLARGRTCITVAHRFSTITDADCIISMANGEVLEKGSKEELLAKDGLFAKLYKLQVLNKQ